ncbi:MAG: hypothetical protein ABEJ61_04395 [Haloferacaceae archaeon]
MAADAPGRERVRWSPWSTVVRRERLLWGVVLVTLLLDCVLTAYGLSIGLVERNPVAARLVARLGAVPSFAVLKGGVLVVALAGRRLLPDRYTPVVPLALALPWGVAVVVNAAVIARA